MTHEKFMELYDKYQPWFGKPIEIFSASNRLGERHFKKFLLMDIKGVMRGNGHLLGSKRLQTLL